MSKKHILCCTALVLLVPAAACAQIFEIGGHAGYTLTDGIGFTPTLVMGRTYDEVKHTDSFSWGFTAGARVRRGYGIGFLFDRQQSELQVGGPAVETNLSDVNVDNYHGIFSFDGPLTPTVSGFFFFGLGATSFGEVNIMGRSVDGPTEFSTTWGLGIKTYPKEGNIGLRAGVRWTPTYMKTDPDGWWCDPYWGCTTYGDPDYIHQVQFFGGISYRFETRG
jgi:hypothetical protein